MGILKGAAVIFMGMIIFSFAITAWDLFVTDPCQSFNRGYAEGCEQ